MFTTGLAIFLGLVFIAIKLPRCTMARWLRYDVVLAVAVALIVLAIHFGTCSGVMAATFAGLLTSIGTSGAKRLFGYIQGDVYHHGLIRLAV